MLPLTSPTILRTLAGTAFALLLLLTASPRTAAAKDARIERAVAQYAEVEGTADVAKVRARLVKEVGALTKSRNASLRLEAIEALGRMGDKGAARYLKPFVKPLRDGKGAATTGAAIDAAGKVRSDALVAPLLRVVDKSKNFEVARAAVLALSAFGDSERHRERILDELATTLRRDLPSAPKRGHVIGTKYIPGKHGSAGTSRWGALSPIVPQALNKLTGQSYATVYEWIDVVRSYKRNLDALFPQPK